MKLLLCIGLLIVFTSCASNRSKDVPSEVYELEDKDFNRPKPYSFNPNDDYFKKAKGGVSNDSLKYESIQRIDSSDLDDKDVIANLAKLCQGKEFDDSIKYIRENYQRFREHPAFWNQVGVCYLLKNDHKKALLFFNKSIDNKKDYAPAFNNLGVMYWRKNELDKAQVAFERAKKYGQFSNTPKLNLAFLYLQFQLSQKAEPLFEGLYRLGSKDRDVISGLMTSYLFNNKYSSAQKICTHIDRDLLELPQFGINCAKSFYYEKDYKMARSIFEKIDDDKLGNWKDYYFQTKKMIGVK